MAKKLYTCSKGHSCIYRSLSLCPSKVKLLRMQQFKVGARSAGRPLSLPLQLEISRAPGHGFRKARVCGGRRRRCERRRGGPPRSWRTTRPEGTPPPQTGGTPACSPCCACCGTATIRTTCWPSHPAAQTILTPSINSVSRRISRKTTCSVCHVWEQCNCLNAPVQFFLLPLSCSGQTVFQYPIECIPVEFDCRPKLGLSRRGP